MTSTEVQLDTFPKWLRHHAQARPGAPALREKRRGIWQTLSWSAFEAEVRALAAAMHHAGFRRGQHAALLGDNRPRLYTALCAVQWLGGVAVPLYPDATADELAEPLRAAGVTLVFAENQEQVDKLLELLPRLPAIDTVVYDADRGMRHYRQPQLVSHEDFLTRGRMLLGKDAGPVDAQLAGGRADDPAVVCFVREGEAAVRGVVLTHAALIDRAQAAMRLEGLGADDCTLAYLPQAWAGQQLFGFALPMVAGCCVCCPESSETMLADMREIGPTFLFLPPRLLTSLIGDIGARMADANRWKRGLHQWSLALARRVGSQVLDGRPLDAGERIRHGLGNLLIYGPLRDVLGMSRLRMAYTTGGAVDSEVLRFFRALGVNLKQFHGTAQTGVLVSVQPDGQVRPDTVGVAAPGVELRFTAQRELLVRSPGLFAGFLDGDGLSRDGFDTDGWYHTGDAGHVGSDGHLRILDRVDDLVALADGRLFTPGFIERRLEATPYIRAAAAFCDQRTVVSVLLALDTQALTRWAAARGTTLEGAEQVAADPDVRALLGESIARLNADMAAEPLLAATQVQRFVVLPQGLLDGEDGLGGAASQAAGAASRRGWRARVASAHPAVLQAVATTQERVRIEAVLHDAHGQPRAALLDLAIAVAPAANGLRQAA